MEIKALLDDARDKHEQWYQELVNSIIDHHGQVGDEMAVSHQECAFGEWLNHVGMQIYHDVNEMRELNRHHREFHGHVQALVGHQHHHMKSRREYVQIEQSRDAMMHSFDLLETRLADPEMQQRRRSD
ncbi:MAG: CZB domain-containing protein [Gammaproteobacteria bacterium]|nr:CZB domain-containing protein [Gammaproteobacteria bacterium]